MRLLSTFLAEVAAAVVLFSSSSLGGMRCSTGRGERRRQPAARTTGRPVVVYHQNGRDEDEDDEDKDEAAVNHAGLPAAALRIKARRAPPSCRRPTERDESWRPSTRAEATQVRSCAGESGGPSLTDPQGDESSSPAPIVWWRPRKCRSRAPRRVSSSSSNSSSPSSISMDLLRLFAGKRLPSHWRCSRCSTCRRRLPAHRRAPSLRRRSAVVEKALPQRRRARSVRHLARRVEGAAQTPRFPEAEDLFATEACGGCRGRRVDVGGQPKKAASRGQRSTAAEASSRTASR